MERDMDLVRDILNQVAAHPAATGRVPLEIAGHSSEEVSYHVKLLAQAGYLDAENASTQQNFEWRAESLTWVGHELRDTLKNDNVWQKVKATIADKGGGASIEIVKELAMRISRRYFLGELDE